MQLSLGPVLDNWAPERWRDFYFRIADEAPVSMYELFEIAGEAMEPSNQPLQNPWHLVVDNSLARRLGFHPEVRTVFQAAEENIL